MSLPSDFQIRFITAIPCVAATFSVIGSSIILFMIKTKRVVCNWTFTRLMIGICVFDLVGSSWTMLGPLPVPSPEIGDEDSILFLNSSLNKGTTATCTAQGFFFYLGGMGIIGYNCSLMMYYILTVVFELSEQVLLQVEPYLHAFPLVFSISTNVAGLFLTAYNPSYYRHRCGLNAYPYNCDVEDSTTCVRGSRTSFLVSNFMAMPSVLCLCFLLLSVLWIYCCVRRRNRQIEENHTLDDIDRYSNHSLKAKNSRQHNKTLNEVSKQSLIYAIVFSQSLFWVFLRFFLRIAGVDVNPNAMYVIRVFAEIAQSMQGFFNMLVFVRMRYHRSRRRYPNKSRLWAFQNCIFEKPAQNGILERYRRQSMRHFTSQSLSSEFNIKHASQESSNQHHSSKQKYNQSEQFSVRASSESSSAGVLEIVVEEDIADAIKNKEVEITENFDESETEVVSA